MGMGRVDWDPLGEMLEPVVPVRVRRSGEERDFAIFATSPPVVDLLLSATSEWWWWWWW